MAALLDRKLYSYRDDPAVPSFADAGRIAVMDGDCALCSWGARAIARLDRTEILLSCPAQSPLDAALARHYGLEPGDPETWQYLSRGAVAAPQRVARLDDGRGVQVRHAPRSREKPMRVWLGGRRRH